MAKCSLQTNSTAGWLRSSAVPRTRCPAAEAGYKIGKITTLDFHADNPAFKNDGRIMDPAHPETLVDAAGPDGPVLLGAMFQMDELGDTGPAIGGPLTVWHAHDHVCISFTGMTGAVSPLGACSLGSVAIPITNEMIHVFVLDVPRIDSANSRRLDQTSHRFLALHLMRTASVRTYAWRSLLPIRRSARGGRPRAASANYGIDHRQSGRGAVFATRTCTTSTGRGVANCLPSMAMKSPGR